MKRLTLLEQISNHFKPFLDQFESISGQVFGTIFKSFFIKFRDHFGSFLGAFWKWPLRGSRGHFHLVSNFISSLFLTPFCMPLGTHLGAKIAQVGAKMALSCPTWRQDEPKMANLEPKMANLAHFWEHLGNFFCILGAILPKMAKTEKTTIVQHF